MRAWLTVVTGIAAVVLVSFLIVEALQVPILTDPSEHLDQATTPAAVLGIALLVVDVLVPVPSSLVMTAQGALFGVFWGTLFSLVGSTGAGLIGFAIGRKGTALMDRHVSPQARNSANQLLERWGVFALILSRPIPILAETVAIVAGTTTLSWIRAGIGIVAGALPAALLYAIAGANATDWASSMVITGIVCVVAAAAWLIGRAIEQRLTSRGSMS